MRSSILVNKQKALYMEFQYIAIAIAVIAIAICCCYFPDGQECSPGRL